MHLHPPVYFLITTTLGVSLRWIPFGLPPFPGHLSILASVLLTVGMSLGGFSVYLFLKAHTGVIPFSPTTTIVRGGFYRITRNPMYLGLLCIQLSLLLLFSNLPSLLVVPVFWWILHSQFVLKEEQLLRQQFGESYEQLLQETRRWL